MNFHIIIGQTIRKLRLERGWRQEDLAMYSGVPRTQILRIELGRYPNVGIDTLAKISCGLRVHIGRLMKDCPKE